MEEGGGGAGGREGEEAKGEGEGGRGREKREVGGGGRGQEKLQYSRYELSQAELIHVPQVAINFV